MHVPASACYSCTEYVLKRQVSVLLRIRPARVAHGARSTSFSRLQEIRGFFVEGTHRQAGCHNQELRPVTGPP